VRLTIDSNDNIDQVLQAVSALFGVAVTTGGDTSGDTSGSSSAPAAPARRGAKTAKAAKTAKTAPANRGGGRGRTTGGARASRSRPDSGAVREWAKQNGFDVSDRGRIPSRVISAYQEANRG
jgi:hypothetical protein